MYSSLYIGSRREVVIVNSAAGELINVPPYRVLEDHGLMYVLDGRIKITLDEKLYTLGKDDVMFLHAGHPHFASAVDNNAKIFYVHLKAHPNDSMLTACTPEEIHNNQYIVLKDSFHCSNTQAVKRLFDEMVSIRFFTRNDYTFKEFGLSVHLDSLLYELRCDLDSTSFFTNDIVSRATRRIATQITRFYTLEEMAETLDCSKKTLEKSFKSQTSYTFHQYQIYKKIEQISIVLKLHPNTPLKVLADQYGFYDEFHLSKSFKKVLGVSPKEYRAILKMLQSGDN